MTWKMLWTMMRMLPLLLLTARVHRVSCQQGQVEAVDQVSWLEAISHRNTVWYHIFQFNRSESEFLYNLTTIEPDDETINTLIEAVDTAVTELQNAIGGTTDSSSNYDYEFAPDDVQYPDYIFVDDEDEDEGDFDYSEGLLYIDWLLVARTWDLVLTQETSTWMMTTWKYLTQTQGKLLSRKKKKKSWSRNLN